MLDQSFIRPRGPGLARHAQCCSEKKDLAELGGQQPVNCAAIASVSSWSWLAGQTRQTLHEAFQEIYYWQL